MSPARILSAALFLGAVSSLADPSPSFAQAGPRVTRPSAGPAAPAPAPASERVAPAGKVSVQIMVVYATSSQTGVDPRLGNLTRYLSNLKYSGYQLLDSQTAQLSPNGGQTFAIEGGRKVSVTLLSRDDQKARMRVEITQGSSRLLDTTLSVNRNGTFIVAGPRFRDGILVLPLTARY